MLKKYWVVTPEHNMWNLTPCLTMQPVLEEGETQTRLLSFAERRYPVNTVVVICHVTKATFKPTTETRSTWGAKSISSKWGWPEAEGRRGHMRRLTQNSGGGNLDEGQIFSKTALYWPTRHITQNIHITRLSRYIFLFSFSPGAIEWLRASLGRSPILIWTESKCPNYLPPALPRCPQCFQGAGLLSSRVTKRPPPEDGVGGWGSMRRGAPRFRDDCMELFTMGDSRSGHQDSRVR